MIRASSIRLLTHDRIEKPYAFSARCRPRDATSARSTTRGGGNPKTGGEVKRVTLNQADAAAERPYDVIPVEDALEAFLLDSRKSQVVEMKLFGGLSVAETAHALGVHRRR
jgi:hypothetical protein